jgi:hypothetical protein
MARVSSGEYFGSQESALLKVEAGKAFQSGLKLAAAPQIVQFLPAAQPSFADFRLPRIYLPLER